MARLSGNCEENDAVVNNSKSPKAHPNCDLPFNKKHNLSPPHWLPNFLISNVRSITNKIDELSAVVSTNQIDMVCITETWLCSIIPDLHYLLRISRLFAMLARRLLVAEFVSLLITIFIVNVWKTSKIRQLNRCGYLLGLNDSHVRSLLYCWRSSDLSPHVSGSHPEC